MSLSLVVDGLLILLLLATLVYVARLNRRLGQIRDARQEFEALIRRFAQATEQADRSIEGVKAAAAAEGKELQGTIDRSRGLREDLVFLVEKANGLADRLEASIARTRKDAPVQGQAQGQAQAQSRAQPAAVAEKPTPFRHRLPTDRPPMKEARREPQDAAISAGERDLMKALASIR